MLKFVNEIVKPREFYNFATTFTDINDINVDCLTVSDPVLANKGADQRYIIGYHTRDLVVALRVKTPGVWSNGVSQYNANAVSAMSLDFEEYPDWVAKVWNKIEKLISQKLTTEPVKKDRYVNAKLKYYKDVITTNFHGQSVPHNEACKLNGVLAISSVYGQGSNYYPQVHVVECKYTKLNKWLLGEG